MDNREAATSYLAKVTDRLTENGINAQSETLYGMVAESIAEYAARNDVDLILVATHGRSGISRWVWDSVAERVLRSSCVPVLMVRAPGCQPGI